MVFVKILVLVLVFATNLQKIYSHGTMMDPVSRNSAWRKGFPVPRNDNDNELFCGGHEIQHEKNGGMCGECGDDWSLFQPRPNENGGIYGRGVIVKKYKAGTVITVKVHLFTSHRGHFEFHLCPLKYDTELETEECFQKYPLLSADGSGYKFPVPNKRGNYKIKLLLPKNVASEHCVLRWHYRAGNNWGICPDGEGAMGCGPQETYRNCADIAIW